MTDTQNNIYAKILADSISPNGTRLTTFEVQFPKVLLAEANTHRLLSRNYSSSRAIPNAKFVDVESFEPQYYGLNQAGMMAKQETIAEPEKAAKIWKRMIKYCKTGSQMLNELKLHKQWSNRPNDWHTMVKGVISSTEWNNFTWLRYHESAQPEFFELARLISSALDTNEPKLMQPGFWHLPYVKTVRHGDTIKYFDKDDTELSLENAQKVSSSCCAQVSYRNLDQSLEKSIDIYEKLVGSDRKHSSAFEHCATPMIDCSIEHHSNMPFIPSTWEAGITHVRKDSSLWSGNLRGWVQYRQLIPGEAKW